LSAFKIECNEVEDGFVNVLLGVQQFSYISDGKNTTINHQIFDESLNRTIEACRYQTECDLNYNQFTNAKSPSTVSFKLTCLKTINKDKYQLICILFIVFNPLCFFLFLFYSDRILEFLIRFIAQFKRESI
jgi:hypothetical protein